jgi:two-component system alkaline phosphatase synthesis response regulator PhoP
MSHQTASPDVVTDGTILICDVKIVPDDYEAFKAEERLELSHKEFKLLVYLAKTKGRVYTRDQLLSAIWNYAFVGDTRIVDVHISHVREKIEPHTKKPIYIKTMRGLGYKMEEPKPE